MGVPRSHCGVWAIPLIAVSLMLALVLLPTTSFFSSLTHLSSSPSTAVIQDESVVARLSLDGSSVVKRALPSGSDTVVAPAKRPSAMKGGAEVLGSPAATESAEAPPSPVAVAISADSPPAAAALGAPPSPQQRAPSSSSSSFVFADAIIINMSTPDPYDSWGDEPNATTGWGATSWGAPRIFDTMLFYNEIELLEIRIAELFDAVEKFVVVETLTTFGGARTRENGYFDKMKESLPMRFRNKIVHCKCHLVKKGDAWDREENARQCVKRAAHYAGLRRYDMLHLADADEFPRSTMLTSIRDNTQELMRSTTPTNERTFRELNGWFPFAIRMQYFAQNFNTVLAPDKPNWFSDLYLIFDAKTMRIANRKGVRKTHTREAGWHCSWCFPKVSMYKEKFLSFSHTESVDARNYAPENVWNATCNLGNIFEYAGPVGRKYLRVSAGGYMTPPQYLLDHATDPRFAFLLPDNVTCKIPL